MCLRPLKCVLAAETRSRTSGTSRVMEPALSDVECLALSLAQPAAFELIFERHFGAVHGYLHRRAGRDLPMISPPRRSRSRSSNARAADRPAAFLALAVWDRDQPAASLLEGRTSPTARVRSQRDRPLGRPRRGRRGRTRRRRDAPRSIRSSHVRSKRCLRRQRDALLLYALADLSYEEVAIALGVPVGTVRTWFTEPARSRNANSPQTPNSPNPQAQEPICMDDLSSPPRTHPRGRCPRAKTRSAGRSRRLAQAMGD